LLLLWNHCCGCLFFVYLLCSLWISFHNSTKSDEENTLWLLGQMPLSGEKKNNVNKGPLTEFNRKPPLTAFHTAFNMSCCSNCTSGNCGPINSICSTSLGGQPITEHAINKMEMCMDSFCSLGTFMPLMPHHHSLLLPWWFLVIPLHNSDLVKQQTCPKSKA
jgi:hypothetical protein